MCTHIQPPTPFPHHLLPPTGANLRSLGKTSSALLFFDFAEEKREKEKHEVFVCLR
jgi:hypothetical protein